MSDKKAKSAQHIWPIFLVAVLLGIFGFGMALKSTPKPLPVKNVKRLTFETPPLSEEKNAVKIVHKNLNRKYDIYIVQETSPGSKKNSASFSFTVVEEKKSEKVFHRTFENAAIEIYTLQKQIDAPISFDVARLIQTTKYEVKLDDRGNQTVKLISSDPGKLQSVLRMIESSLTLLNTTLPKEEMPVEEKWDHQSPGKNPEFKATRRVLGQTPETAIIRQHVNQFNTLKSVEAIVSGSGTSIINKADGGLKAGKLTLQSIVELKDRKHVSSTTIVLKAIQEP